MNILYTNFHLGNGGGHTTYLNYLFNGALSNGINVFMAAPGVSRLNKDLRKDHLDRVFDIEFPGKLKELLNMLRNANKLRNVIVEKQIDIVHVNGTPDHKVVMFCKWLYRLEFSIIRTKHDSFVIKENWLADKLYGKYTDRMITVSHYQFDHVITEQLRNKTSVIHNGVDLDYYQPREKSTNLIKQFDIQDKDIVFVSVAGTALHKGWQFLVEAASKLDDELRHKVKIIIVGNTPKDEIVERYVKQFNMVDNVIFTGFVSDVREAISIADIGFVLSIGVETISFACREMMAMGKPTLVSDYAGLSENIDENQKEWIVKQGSAEQIQVFLQQIEGLNLNGLSDSTQQKAKSEFGLEGFLSKTIASYQGLRCD